MQTATVSDLSPEKKPNLTLVQGDYEIDRILEHIGVSHDSDSIILEDSYNCLWVDTDNGEYVEVWGSHQNVPYSGAHVERLL